MAPPRGAKTVRLTNVDNVRVMQVIVVESVVGDGASVPIHAITEYYSMEGELLARNDTRNPVRRRARDEPGEG